MTVKNETLLEAWERIRKAPQTEGRCFQFMYEGSLFTSLFVDGKHREPVLVYFYRCPSKSKLWGNDSEPNFSQVPDKETQLNGIREMNERIKESRKRTSFDDMVNSQFHNTPNHQGNY